MWHKTPADRRCRILQQCEQQQVDKRNLDQMQAEIDLLIRRRIGSAAQNCVIKIK